MQYLGLSGKSKSNPMTKIPNPAYQEKTLQPQETPIRTPEEIKNTAVAILKNCHNKGLPGYLKNKGYTTTDHEVNKSRFQLPNSKQFVPVGALVLPIKDINNLTETISVQYIPAYGKIKYHLTGFKKENGVIVIPGDEILPYIAIGTGYATCLAFALAMGCPTFSLFDDKNLINNCTKIANLYLGKRVFIIGDNDSHKGHTSGQDAALEASRLTNGIALIPPYDDWDFHRREFGIEATRSEIERQLKLKEQKSKDSEMSTIDVDIAEESIEEITKKDEKIGFKLLQKVLVFHDKKEGGTIEAITVSSRIEVEASQADLYNDKSEGMTLKCTNKRGKIITLSIPRRLLADERELCALFFDIGLSIYKKKLLMGYLMDSNPKKHYSSVSRIGWHHFNEGDFFVLPNQTIGHNDDKNMLVYQSDHLNTLFKSKGTIEQWRENISKPCAGNSRIVFALSHGLASMLLSPTNSTNGGINLFGESSTGKTTIARVCGSIFSDPNYVESCRTTTNALENTALSHNDCLLILDEILQMNSKDMGDTVYTLCNGMGKSRMKANIESHPIIKFRNNYLFTGEIPVSQHTREGGSRETEGQLVRVLDIPAVISEHGVFDCLPEGFKSGAEFSNYLKEQSTRYYGTCLIAFLEELTKPQNIAKIPEKLKQVKEKLIEGLPQKIQGQTERAINRFALAACAGELATEWGLTGWQPDEAITSSRKCLDAWLAERGGVENKEGAKLLQQVRAFFGAHGNSRFIDTKNQEVIIHKCAGFKELENDEWVYYVYPHAFEEIHKGFTKKFAIQILKEVNWIDTATNGEACQQKRIKGLKGYGKARFYIFNQLMWE